MDALSSAFVKILREYIYISSLEDNDYLFPEYYGENILFIFEILFVLEQKHYFGIYNTEK